MSDQSFLANRGHKRQFPLLTGLYALFALLGSFSVGYTFTLNRVYQDAWILDSIWPFVLGIIAIYILIVVKERRAERVALISAVLLFVCYFIPTVKYQALYGSANDVAYHATFARELVNGVFNQEQIYSSTPGFHVLLALLSRLSGLSIESCVKIFLPFLVFILPLGTYMICKAGRMPVLYTKVFCVFSVLASPAMYNINGTTYTIFLPYVLICIYTLGELATEGKYIYSIAMLLCCGTLLFWHPFSSIVFPLLLLGLGALSFVNRKKRWLLLPKDPRLFVIGLMAVILVISYWIYDADFVWTQLVTGLQQAFTSDSIPAIVPQRLFEIILWDQLVIILLFHARDLLLVGLALLGTMLYFRRYRRSRKRNAVLEIQISVFLAFLALMAVILVVQYGSQGYKRYLFFLVAFSVFPAGFGLVELLDGLKHIRLRLLGERSLGIVLAAIILISFLQIFPFQPLVPAGANLADVHQDPVVWLHQVNSLSQETALSYAVESLTYDRHPKIYIDYFGIRQVKIFGFQDFIDDFRIIRSVSQGNGYLLLHLPGEGGAYSEQVEYRTLEVLLSVKSDPSMNIIYDNGKSFILYYPGDLSALDLLEK